MFIDFKAVKRLASLEQIATWLGLEIKNNRCQCPVSEGENRELVLSFDKGLWTCFGCKKKYGGKQGGDQIALVSHVLQVNDQQAAQHIQTKFHGYTPAPKGLPESGLDYLQYTEEVKALGLSEEKCQELGIGYTGNRGTMRQHVVFPIRDQKGKLRGYIGISPGTVIKLPSDFVIK